MRTKQFRECDDELHNVKNNIAGTCFTIGAALATLLTGGAADPGLLAALTWTGVAVGATGAGLKCGGGIHRLKAKAVLEDLEAAIKEDEAA